MCDSFPRKFDVQTSYKPENVIFVVNLKFRRAAYHTIVPSTKELCCLISDLPQETSLRIVSLHPGVQLAAREQTVKEI